MINFLVSYLNLNSPEKLSEEFKIDIKQHSKYPNLYLFKYDQIESPMDNPIVQMCRGIILDRDQSWLPICYGYEKFFNHGEQLAKEIDWKTARVYDKLDGSLCQLYYYDNQWHVATSGTPDASGQVGSFNFTFKELFWKVWDECGLKLPEDTTKCYLFELLTQYNRIVVQHTKNKIVLHGCRSLVTYQEEHPEGIAEANGWECVRSFGLSNLDDIIKSLAHIDPIQQEGYVVCDDKFNRVKIKAPQYVALHHAVTNMSPRRMLEIVRMNEGSEVLTYFPEWKEFYDEIKTKYMVLLGDVKSFYDTVKHHQDRKAFALCVKDHRLSGALFAVHNKKYKDFEEYFSKMRIQDLESCLGLKE